jgi:hypothetical protein
VTNPLTDVTIVMPSDSAPIDGVLPIIDDIPMWDMKDATRYLYSNGIPGRLDYQKKWPERQARYALLCHPPTTPPSYYTLLHMSPLAPEVRAANVLHHQSIHEST